LRRKASQELRPRAPLTAVVGPSREPSPPTKALSSVGAQPAALEVCETDSYQEDSATAAGAVAANTAEASATAGLEAAAGGDFLLEQGSGGSPNSGVAAGDAGPASAAASSTAASTPLADTWRRLRRSALASWGWGAAAVVCCGLIYALCWARQR
jgi:hypothetical protein